MLADLLGTGSGAPRHVVWVVAQGLGAAQLDFYGADQAAALKTATINLKAMASMGVQVMNCAGLTRPNPTDAIVTLLGGAAPNPGAVAPADPTPVITPVTAPNVVAHDAGQQPSGHGWLPRRASEAGKLWLSLWPHHDVAALAHLNDGSDLSRCELAVDLKIPPAGLGWDALLAATPRAVVENLDDGEQFRSFVEGVLARFPGRATQRRRGDRIRPIDAWLEWLGDAFLRSVWYALARPTGMFAFLHHPGPALYGWQDGPEGFRRGVAAVDDLVGRLLMLHEHDQTDSMLLIVSGDYAWHDAAGNLVPVLLLAPDPATAGAVVSTCTLADVTRVVAASLF